MEDYITPIDQLVYDEISKTWMTQRQLDMLKEARDKKKKEGQSNATGEETKPTTTSN